MVRATPLRLTRRQIAYRRAAGSRCSRNARDTGDMSVSVGLLSNLFESHCQWISACVSVSHPFPKGYALLRSLGMRLGAGARGGRRTGPVGGRVGVCDRRGLADAAALGRARGRGWVRHAVCLSVCLLWCLMSAKFANDQPECRVSLALALLPPLLAFELLNPSSRKKGTQFFGGGRAKERSSPSSVSRQLHPLSKSFQSLVRFGFSLVQSVAPYPRHRFMESLAQTADWNVPSRCWSPAAFLPRFSFSCSLNSALGH